MKRDLEVWKLGDNKDESDYLFDLVKQGKKTATSYLYDDTFIPPVQFSILSNWDETEELLIKTTKYYIVPFKEVTEVHARKEGEGSGTLEYWRAVHKTFFMKRLAIQGKPFSEDVNIVCEEFIRVTER